MRINSKSGESDFRPMVTKFVVVVSEMELLELPSIFALQRTETNAWLVRAPSDDPFRPAVVVLEFDRMQRMLGSIECKLMAL